MTMGGSSRAAVASPDHVLRGGCQYRQWLSVLSCVILLSHGAHAAANASAATVTQTLAPTPAPVNSLITKPVMPREKVALPAFSPTDASPYVLSVAINITCPTEGALLRYTTDGSSPLSSPTAVAVPAAAHGATVVWDKLGWTVFKASASKAAYNDSDVAEASYLVLGRAGVPVFGGTTHDNVYIGFANLTVTSETPGAVIEYTTDGSSAPSGASDSIPSGGTFLWDKPGTSVIRARAVKGDYAPSAIVELTLTVIEQVATPHFAPLTRSSFVETITLTVQCATPNVLVWYTWDGSAPVPGQARSARAGEQIGYNHTGLVVLTALATRDGLLDSRLETRRFDVIGKVALPRFLFSTPPFDTPDEQHAVVVRNASFTIVTDTPGANISYIAVDATPVVPDYEDGDFDSYTPLSSKPKPPEPTWQLLPHRGRNLSCGVLGFTHFRAVARRPGMADSDVAHLYLHVIRELVVEYPMHHVDDHFTLLAQVLREGSGNGTRNSTSLLDVGEEQPSPDDSMDATPLPQEEEGEGQGAGDAGASDLAPDVRADDDAMPETKSPTRRPTQSTRDWDAQMAQRHYDDDSWAHDPPPPLKTLSPTLAPTPTGPADDPTPTPPTSPTPSGLKSGEGESGPPSPAAGAAAGAAGPTEGLDGLGGTRKRHARQLGKTDDKNKKKKKRQQQPEEKPTAVAASAVPAAAVAAASAHPSPSGLGHNGSHPLPASNGSLSSNSTEHDTWRPVNGSNSSTLSTPHRRFRRPLSVQGYEGVQPLLSMHVVQAQFRDCSWCTPRRVKGRFVTLDNPAKHFSLLPQRQGCGHGPELPSISGRAFSLPERPTHYLPVGFNASLLQRLNQLTDSQYAHVKDLGCQVVTNGGFFNTTSYDCFGNLVSQGRVVRTSDKHVTSFGLRNGSFVVGYLTPQQIRDTSNPFQELISGLGWLVREGQSYVEESLRLEDLSFQETGTQFATVKSARTALGHDRRGRLVLVQMEGETWSSGVDLYELADLLVELGVVNAINLDGGGSATLTQNHSLVSDPSWLCDKHNPKSLFRCEKPVASITCIHAAPPPIFAPVEVTWANYTNITHARAQAQRMAEEQAALAARSQLCAGFCPRPSPPHLNLSMANATAIKAVEAGMTWAGDEKARYKAWSVVLGVCLLVSLGLHVHTCWTRYTPTHKHTRRESQHALLGPGLLHHTPHSHASPFPGGPPDGPPDAASTSTSTSTATSGGVSRRRTSWGLRELGGRVGRGSSHGSAGFERVRLDDNDNEEEVEIEIDSFQPAVAEGGGAERRPSLVEAIGGWLNLNRLARPKGRRRSREGEGEMGVREMELELNPFLAGAFPAGTREAAMM